MDELEKKLMEIETYKVGERKEARLLGVIGPLIGLIAGSLLVGYTIQSRYAFYGGNAVTIFLMIASMFLIMGAIGLTGALLSIKRPKVGAIIQFCLAAAQILFILVVALSNFLVLFWLIWPALHIVSAKRLSNTL